MHRSAIVIDTHADTTQRLLDEHYDLTQPLNGGYINFDVCRTMIERDEQAGRHDVPEDGSARGCN